MSLFSRIKYLKAQIFETKNLLDLVDNDPLMSVGMRERLEDLEAELQELEEKGEIKEPRVQLLFSGKAVSGSQGVRADFIAHIVNAFQEMVKAEATILNVGRLPKRGKITASKNSSLYLTSLPRGSFGIELAQIETESNLFAPMNMAEAIDKVMSFIEESSKDDESFEKVSENLPSRSVMHLTKFLKHISNEDSIIKMESGTRQIQISENDVKSAFIRVSETSVNQEVINVDGDLRGILLDSGKFEILTVDNRKIQGFINEELTEEDLIGFSELINERCRFKIIIHKKIFSSGATNESFELLEVTVNPFGSISEIKRLT